MSNQSKSHDINESRLTVFRVNTEEDGIREILFEEMKQRRLRQGWGGDNMSLLDGQGEPLDRSTWVSRYNEEYEPRCPGSTHHANMARMLDLKKGDLVVIPKMPDNDHFVLARVTEEYRFGEPPENVGRDDFRHVIPIDPAGLRCFNYRASNDAYAINGLVSKMNHSSSVTFSSQSEEHLIKHAVKLFNGGKDLLEAKTKDELVALALDEALVQAAKAMLEEVSTWNHRLFENAVRLAFEKQGYQQLDCRRYNKKGGDADMVFAPPETVHSHFMPGEVIVQVKWKQGTDWGDSYGVEQLVKWHESSDPSASKFLISSADVFTDACKTMAADEGITLLWGLNTMRFLMGLPPKME